MEAKARTCAGMRDVSTCVVKQNREITRGTCKKETSLLVHLGRGRGPGGPGPAENGFKTSGGRRLIQ